MTQVNRDYTLWVNRDSKLACKIHQFIMSVQKFIIIIKIPKGHFMALDKLILNYMKEHNAQNSQDDFEVKNMEEGTHFTR